eukprot:684039-Prymnesium_polylepis.2
MNPPRLGLSVAGGCGSDPFDEYLFGTDCVHLLDLRTVLTRNIPFEPRRSMGALRHSPVDTTHLSCLIQALQSTSCEMLGIAVVAHG